MARGPLPDSNRVRRNSPTIPTTNLPAGGRQDPAPKVPAWCQLQKAGRAWWRWAWSTPQAAGWAPGHEAAIARRATLEDDLAALAAVDGKLDLLELLGLDEASDVVDHVEWVISTLKRLAGGKLAVLKEMRELDDRLGLTPKAMAQLRWTIVPDPEQAHDKDAATAAPKSDDLAERRRRLTGAS